MPDSFSLMFPTFFFMYVDTFIQVTIKFYSLGASLYLQCSGLVVQSLSCVGLLGPHVSPLPQAWETYDLLILYSNEG